MAAESSVRIKTVESGGTSHFAMADDGTVWAWGWNKDGVLGTGQGSGSSMKPVQIKFMASQASTSPTQPGATASDSGPTTKQMPAAPLLWRGEPSGWQQYPGGGRRSSSRLF